jgi:hypothetical protein
MLEPKASRMLELEAKGWRLAAGAQGELKAGAIANGRRLEAEAGA